MTRPRLLEYQRGLDQNRERAERAETALLGVARWWSGTDQQECWCPKVPIFGVHSRPCLTARAALTGTPAPDLDLAPLAEPSPGGPRLLTNLGTKAQAYQHAALAECQHHPNWNPDDPGYGHCEHCEAILHRDMDGVGSIFDIATDAREHLARAALAAET